MSASPLPRTLTPLWHARPIGGVMGHPAIGSRGEIVVAGVTPRVTQLSADGHVEYSVRTSAPPATSAVIASRDRRLVLLRDGTLLCLDAQGRTLATPRPFGAVTSDPPHPLVTRTGTSVFASGSRVARFDAQGKTLATTELPAPVAHLMATGDDIVIVAGTGAVFTWRAFGEPQPQGAFDAPVVGAQLDTRRSVIAVLNTGRLVRLVLGTPTQLAMGVDAAAGTPRNVGEAVLTWLTDGSLVRVTAGNAPETAFGSPAPDGPPPTPSPPPAVDGAGTLVVWAQRRLHRVPARGAPSTLTEPLCERAVALIPAGPGRVLLACEGGTLSLLSH